MQNFFLIDALNFFVHYRATAAGGERKKRQQLQLLTQAL